MKRVLLGAFLAIGAALVVAACGDGSGSGAEDTAAPVAVDAALDGVTIEMHQAPG